MRKVLHPINEGTEEKSQSTNICDDYKGPGIQHLALATEDILSSLRKWRGPGWETLDIDLDYYEEAFQRVPQVTEDREEIKKFQVLVDGDEDGYLLDRTNSAPNRHQHAFSWMIPKKMGAISLASKTLSIRDNRLHPIH